MKTHLIPLDPHDDVISVRDKMGWGKTTRILILWPDTGEILLDRRMDIVLLKRRAEELGASLAFVTRDPEVKSHARELGIPVFRTSREGQSTHWRFRRQRNPLELSRLTRALDGPKFIPKTTDFIHHHPPHSSFQSLLLRISLFIIAIFSVATLASLLFPRAIITLTPETKTQSVAFTAFTSPTVTTINPTGAIPTNPMTVIVEGRKSVPSTGLLNIPKNAATGRVTFANLTDVTVIIPAGTVVLTADFIRFTTDKQAQVPAQAGGMVDVSIIAVQPGPQGNVPASAIQSIEGSLGLQLTVANAIRISGGSSQTLTAPTDLDRQSAYNQLFTSLEESALAEIRAQLSPGDQLLTPSLRLLNIIQESYLPAEETASDTLEAILRLEFQALVLTQLDLQSLVQAVLDASLDPGYEPVANTMVFELLNDPQADDDDHAAWTMVAERELSAILPERAAVDVALGQTPASAGTLLAAANPLAAHPDIQLTPTWWPRMPFLPFQIEVQIGK